MSKEIDTKHGALKLFTWKDGDVLIFKFEGLFNESFKVDFDYGMYEHLLPHAPCLEHAEFEERHAHSDVVAMIFGYLIAISQCHIGDGPYYTYDYMCDDYDPICVASKDDDNYAWPLSEEALDAFKELLSAIGFAE